MNIIWPIDVEILHNLYYMSYIKLITRSLNRINNKVLYYEKHHIIPRSIGGSDSLDNFVFLTAKEHYLAHRFLTRFTTSNCRYKMLYALDAMGMQSKNTTNRWRMPARIYEYNKKLISSIGHSEETKVKIGLANKGRKPHNTGKQRSEETRKKISQSHLGLKGPPANQNIKDAASKYHSNSRWIINNVNKRKRVPKEELKKYLSCGWSLGRVTK